MTSLSPETGNLGLWGIHSPIVLLLHWLISQFQIPLSCQFFTNLFFSLSESYKRCLLWSIFCISFFSWDSHIYKIIFFSFTLSYVNLIIRPVKEPRGKKGNISCPYTVKKIIEMRVVDIYFGERIQTTTNEKSNIYYWSFRNGRHCMAKERKGKSLVEGLF